MKKKSTFYLYKIELKPLKNGVKRTHIVHLNPPPPYTLILIQLIIDYIVIWTNLTPLSKRKNLTYHWSSPSIAFFLLLLLSFGLCLSVNSNSITLIYFDRFFFHAVLLLMLPILFSIYFQFLQIIYSPRFILT